MEKLLALALAGACGAAVAQTPATNPMPDGSRDMYLGLGAMSAPRYDGASDRRVSALPVLQAEFSNGIFVSGLSAGMHMSGRPTLEFGPLLALQTRRSESGMAPGLGNVTVGQDMGTLAPPQTGPIVPARAAGANPLVGMDDVKARLTVGAFYNVYLNPQVRLTSSFLYGAGNDHQGVLATIGAQRIASEIAPHHWLSAGVGVSLANRSYQATYFGVSYDEALRSGNDAYAPGGGIKDVHANARWNWVFTPAWMLTSSLNVTRLQGDARKSPLVQRSTNLSVSTALAYRF